MPEANFEYQEKIRRLAVKIVKDYKGKGPESVKVKLENDSQVTVEIRGILSNLSEILLKECADELVEEYWKVLKPYLEREYMEELIEAIGWRFTYSWRLCGQKQQGRTVIIQLNKSV